MTEIEKQEQLAMTRALCFRAEVSTKLLREILELTDKIDFARLTPGEREQISKTADYTELLYEEIQAVLEYHGYGRH